MYNASMEIEEYDPDNPALFPPREEGLQTVHKNLKRTLRGWRRNQPLPEYGALVDKMSDYFKRHAFEPQNELEVRIGKLYEKPRRFESGVSANMFGKILESLRSCQTWEDESIINHVDYFHGDKRLRVYDDPGIPPEIVSKRSLLSMDVQALGSPFDFRFSVSKEKAINASERDIAEIMEKVKTVRYKERITFAYKVWLFDLTVVKSQNMEPPAPSDDCFDDTSEERNGGRLFEVELEINNVAGKLEKTAHNAFYLADSTLLKLFDIMNFVEDVDVQALTFVPFLKSGKK